MHDFPPLWWPLTNYGLGGLPIFLMFVVATLLVFSIRVRGGRWECVARTALLVGLPPVMVLWVDLSRPSVLQPLRGPMISALLLMLILIALQAAMRALRKYREAGNSWESVGRLALIGLCCGFLLPVVFQPSRGASGPPAAMRTQCKNNLKQIGLALHNYHDVNSMFPIAVQPKFDRSWRVTVLPFLDQAPLYERYNHHATWEHPDNAPLAAVVLPALDCPARPFRLDDHDRFLSAYSALTGPETAFGDREYVKRNEFTDGLANTLMVAETCGKPIIWTQPKDVNTATDEPKINAPGNALHESNGVMSSYHTGGAQVLLGDGSVRFMGEQTEPELLRQLMTRDGNVHGEPRTPDFF